MRLRNSAALTVALAVGLLPAAGAAQATPEHDPFPVDKDLRWHACVRAHHADPAACPRPTPRITDSPLPAPLGAGDPGGGDPYYPGSGNGGYDVADYAVDLSYNPADGKLAATTAVTARATEELDRFNLDLHGLTVTSVRVDGAAATFTRDGDELVITPATPLTSGSTFRAEVAYHGVPGAIRDPRLGDNGWQRSKSGGAYAAGEPYSASTWFPVNDIPTDKATFHLTATVPDGWSVVGNGLEGGRANTKRVSHVGVRSVSGPERGAGKAEEGAVAAPRRPSPTQSSVDAQGREPDSPRETPSKAGTVYRWTETTPLASYLATIAIDKWTVDRSTLADGTPVVDAYAPGAESKRKIEKRLPEILQFLTEKFGPYPVDAAGGIFLADNIGFSLETQSRPIYAQWTDLSVVVHENAHQWFGNSVSVRNWRDICLNECFASYAQWLWSEAKEGTDLDATYRSKVRNASAGYWAGKLYDMGRGNEFTSVYGKGAVALHALRRQLGDDHFFALLRRWTAKHRDGNASWPEFEQLAEEVSGQQLDGFFQAWFRGNTKPGEAYLWPGPLKP